MTLDWASAIESNFRGYLLDAEIARLGVGIRRDLARDGARGGLFVGARVTVASAGAGLLDGFFDAYHRLVHARLPERAARPRNEFAYHVLLPDGRDVRFSSSPLALGDLRLLAGLRHGRRLQTTVSLTLPTTTGPAGYGHGTVSLSAIETWRFPLAGTLTYEGSAGLGVTPSHGALAAFEREVFASATSGLRWRSVYANVFAHTPYLHGTRYPQLDNAELSLDFGFTRRTRHGTEWRIGLVEDLRPHGPAIDAILRAGVRF